jgi:hypothetical protein
VADILGIIGNAIDAATERHPGSGVPGPSA